VTRKMLLIPLALLLAMSLVLMACPAPAPREEPVVVDPDVPTPQYITIGTGAPGGVYFPLGGAIAVVIGRMTDHRAAAESTGASVENSRLVGAGEVTMGLAMGSIAYKATQGEAPFEEAIPLKALLNMYASPLQFLTVEGTGIYTIEDLRGRKISIDVPGSGCNVQTRAVLEAHGFSLEKDLTIAELSQAEGVRALIDGVVDAMTLQAAFPSAGVVEVAAMRPLVMIPITQELFNRVDEKMPAIVPVTIPAGTYAGVDYDVFAIGDSNPIIVRYDMPDWLAYELTRVIHENALEGRWALVNVHPIAAQMIPKLSVHTPIPLHSGAIRFFEAVGVAIP